MSDNITYRLRCTNHLISMIMSLPVNQKKKTFLCATMLTTQEDKEMCSISYWLLKYNSLKVSLSKCQNFLKFLCKEIWWKLYCHTTDFSDSTKLCLPAPVNHSTSRREQRVLLNYYSLKCLSTHCKDLESWINIIFCVLSELLC